MPPERGVFLDRTWRMHPDIAAFVSTMSYDDRLEAAPGLERQQVLDVQPAPLSGAGLRWCPVEHEGYSSENPHEAKVVARLVAQLLGGRWADQRGHEHALGVSDILVVAPYNAHVAAVSSALPEGVQVGTVDKFQGRQAPVVIYTMASSSADEAPRGVDFLYDTHRLNVAISRARAMSVVVGSPALLEAAVRTPEQLRAVNALCRFADLATPCP
jgi:superfamily I DNA and/or RNA helicase